MFRRFGEGVMFLTLKLRKNKASRGSAPTGSWKREEFQDDGQAGTPNGELFLVLENVTGGVFGSSIQGVP